MKLLAEKVTKTLSIALYVVVLFSLFLTALSCGGSSASGTFEKILSVIPDTPNNRAWVAINDYAGMRKEFHVNAPIIDAAAEQQKQYLSDLYNLSDREACYRFAVSPGFINSYQYIDFSLEAMRNLDLGYWSIDQEVETGRPPEIITILKGQFDPEKTKYSLETNAKDDPPLSETYNGNTIFSWGGDYEIDLVKRLSSQAYDNLGRGGRFVVQRKYAFRTNATPVIKQALDAQNGEFFSLAEVPEFELMAKELSAQGALNAILTDQTQSIDYIRSLLTASGGYQDEDLDKYLEQGPKLLPYLAIALGMAKDEVGIHLLIILVHTDDQTATENVDLLQQRIDETRSMYFNTTWKSIVTNSSITSHGRVLTAKLYGSILAFGCHWNAWYFGLDPLLLHD